MNFLESLPPESTTIEIPVKEWHKKREKEICTWDLNLQKDLLQNDLITKVASKIIERIKQEVKLSWDPCCKLPTIFKPKLLCFNFHPKRICEELKNELTDKTVFQNQKINTTFWWPRFNKIGNLVARVITNDLKRIEQENILNNRLLIKFNVAWLNDSSALINNQANKDLYLNIKFWHENAEILADLDYGKAKKLSFDELLQPLEKLQTSPKNSLVGDLFEIDLTKSLEEQHKNAKLIKPITCEKTNSQGEYIEIDFTDEKPLQADKKVNHTHIKENNVEECKVN